MPNITKMIEEWSVRQEITDELRRLQAVERMWKRVKQIRAEGCLLTSEDLEEIERQEK